MPRESPPLLLVDVDGVISLWGGADPLAACDPLMVDGIVHLISREAGVHLRELQGHFELAWCTGWEERANDYLPAALGLGRSLHCLTFATVAAGAPHWKLPSIDAHAGPHRPVAWIDDSHDEACHAWAAERPGPTLLVTTDPAVGITRGHVDELVGWARAQDRA